jgi:hypothetical protein
VSTVNAVPVHRPGCLGTPPSIPGRLAHGRLLAHFDDFGAFASLLGAEPRKYGFARSAQHSEPTLHPGWVQGEATYLQS